MFKINNWMITDLLPVLVIRVCIFNKSIER